jgi:hypothetical protein
VREAGNTVRSLGTSSRHQRCWPALNATLTKQFEGFAEFCLELARSAKTTERRARFIQMAGEYRLASLLTSEFIWPEGPATSISSGVTSYHCC